MDFDSFWSIICISIAPQLLYFDFWFLEILFIVMFQYYTKANLHIFLLGHIIISDSDKQLHLKHMLKTLVLIVYILLINIYRTSLFSLSEDGSHVLTCANAKLQYRLIWLTRGKLLMDRPWEHTLRCGYWDDSQGQILTKFTVLHHHYKFSIHHDFVATLYILADLMTKSRYYWLCNTGLSW